MTRLKFENDEVLVCGVARKPSRFQIPAAFCLIEATGSSQHLLLLMKLIPKSLMLSALLMMAVAVSVDSQQSLYN